VTTAGPSARSRSRAAVGYAAVALAASCWGTWPLVLRGALGAAMILLGAGVVVSRQA
jgi:hypothetical protein